MGIIRLPATVSEWETYYDLRYRVLREPLGQPRGSEQNDGDHTGQHFAYWENNRLLAIARLDKDSDTSIYQIRFVAVEFNQQGKGIGKQLMLAVEDEVKAQNGKKIILQARENAVDFYKSLGYELIEKTHLLFGQIQHYLMQKEL